MRATGVPVGAQHGRPIFVSYRRQDSAHVAGRIVDRIAAHLVDRDVFLDVKSVGAGMDFVEAVTKAVVASDVVLAVIGKKWAGGPGEGRLRDAEDSIRLELVTALKNDVPIMPVLVDGGVDADPA